MITIILERQNDFGEWRNLARDLCAAGVPPGEVNWQVQGAPGDLFGRGASHTLVPHSLAQLRVSKRFVDQASRAICTKPAEKFSRLYRLLWRMQREPRLLHNAADADVAWLERADKAIRRDVHKMHAFVRFRKVGSQNEREQFMAWFEPDHFITELAAPFFKRRFPNMDWAIVTPHCTASWDGVELHFTDGGRRSDVPEEDAMEDHWRAYFASIFNPARLKVSAMKSEMPMKYWRNLPEAQLIPELIASAPRKMKEMIEKAPTAPNLLAAVVADRSAIAPTQDSLVGLVRVNSLAKACERCPLFKDATQTVVGEGNPDARLMLVGEQPGDAEDIAGRPFVGPAGAILDRALKIAGIERSEIYLTNAVKHFKFVQRGKRRIHLKPTAAEIDHCRWWLEQERELVSPDLVVALGASAVRGLTGRSVKLGDMRGQLFKLDDGRAALATVHPSYLLRVPDQLKREDETHKFIEDLKYAQAQL